MPRVRNPNNALDKFKDAMNRSIQDCSVSWQPSEYCDQTFTIMLNYGQDLEIEIDVRFYPESYAMSVHYQDELSDESVGNFTTILRNKLDQCIYY